ncbi:hypothetical protein GCM10023189_01620 [Nibrella saemangeumensis]|uniref:Lipoprotein n=1 Tax=Nibrella saemangeumensis TaxID=1084526 RepID=A0ABP8MAT5_9BACT
MATNQNNRLSALKTSVGALLLAVCLSCSGNSNENTNTTETPVLGHEGDTTMSNTPGGAPIQAPADSNSAQGSTLPGATVTPDGSGSANQGTRR